MKPVTILCPIFGFQNLSAINKMKTNNQIRRYAMAATVTLDVLVGKLRLD